MSEQGAKAVAAVLGGMAYHTGGNLWVVLFDRPDGSIVVISEDLVASYDNEADRRGGTMRNFIDFRR